MRRFITGAPHGTIIKVKKLRREWHVAIVSEMTNVRAQNILVRKPKEKRLLGKPRCKGG
jgi:hypothetical protein